MRIGVVLITALSLAACDQNNALTEPVAAIEPDKMMPVEPDGGIGDGAEPLEALQGVIPERFRGVWEHTEGSCQSTKDQFTDMRIELTADRVSFYESAGVVTDLQAVSDTEIEVTLAMTGEGESWTSQMAWSLADDGEALIRQDLDDDGYPDAIRYRRCAK